MIKCDLYNLSFCKVTMRGLIITFTHFDLAFSNKL